MQKPSVGRVVHYYNPIGGTIHAAIIAHVWSDTCVNLAVFDQSGNAYSQTSVVYIEKSEGENAGWTWPPRV